MKTALKILMLEDSPEDAEIIQRLLKKEKMDCEFLLAPDKESFLKALDDFFPEVILSDHSIPQFNSADALIISRKKLPGIPFIMVTGAVSEEFAANIIKQGADDYILKDRMARLPAAIKATLLQRKAVKEITDYKYALDQSAIVAITDQKGIILYANENFCTISQYNLEELIGQDHRLVSSGYHPAEFIRNLWLTIANGKIWRGELRNRAKDGSIYWVDTYIVPFLNEQGKPYQYLAIRQDITKRKKVEEELRQSEANLSKAQRVAKLGSWDYDVKADRIIWSEELYNVFGIEKQLFAKTHDSFLQLIDKKDRQAALENSKHTQKTGESFIMDYHITTPKGEKKIIQEHGFGEKDDNGNVIRLFGTAQDITETKKAEEELRKSELRLNEAQAVAHIANWEVDVAQNTHTWSDELYRIFGLNKDEVKPSTELFLSFIHSDDTSDAEKLVTDSLQHFTDSKIDFRFKGKYGKKRYGHIEWRFDFDESGKPFRIFGILQDITERKEAEESMKMLEKKMLAQKQQEQKKIARAVLRGQEKERNFIGQELHDNVNQILAGSKMYLSSAGKKDEKVNNLIKYPMELIDLSIDEIRNLCHTLVTPQKSIKLDELVQDCLDTLSEHSDVLSSLTHTIPDDLIPDDLKLNIYRIVQELLNNVSKYSQAKNIKIVIMSKGGFISITVADDGIGFNTKIKRPGIGISNVIYRAECFNGKVAIKSSAGKGCKVHIKIPY